MSILSTKIQVRNDISTNWESINPILDKGEPGYDYQKELLKIGDGVTPWNSLESLGSIGNEENSNSLSFPFPGGLFINGESANSSANRVIAEKDIIWALGTNFGTSSYENPILSGKVGKISSFYVTESQSLHIFDRLIDNSLEGHEGESSLCGYDPGVIKLRDYLYKPSVIYIQTINNTGPALDLAKSLTFKGIRIDGTSVTLLTATGLPSTVNIFLPININASEYFDKLEITSPDGNHSTGGGGEPFAFASEMLLYGDIQLR